ncbi:MAG: N-6 DNA methylase [Bacteroidales bacterium]|jgi:tRNA1(Val) A37 N6-methylase TrmN6|nr:N-6 DNA methylase [Bacteroidales bacterium]MCK9498983.1 N-6 DNA methylase [Bacteroidales bacterium]MDY0314610.1 TaqI-like C-terminal specificity domain-containing protein [Bacteroidales bacterium]NLB86936.1 N-6 DNA methylase [Bacteroidales bacterium]NLB87051.1 N-6 DNA methylase [Bacteroidales bacterium]
MFYNHSSSVVNTQGNHEKELKNSYRKDFGVFLTNNIQTVDNILDVIDFKDKDILNKKFFEPSCGNGVFVIRLLERIFKEDRKPSQFQNFVESNLCFVDIDQKMVERTKQNIKRYYKIRFNEEYFGSFNAFVYDFTKRIKPKYENSLFDTSLNLPLANFLQKIDYVIGNPPYVSLYGRRDRKKNENQRVYYLNRYSQFPDSLKNGKINYVMLFIEHSIDFLKENGKLSFIIDLAFFETAYEHTRKYLLANTKIQSIKYNIKDFEVASGQVILTLQKTKVENNLVTIINAEDDSVILVDQKLWNNPSDQYKFRFNSCSKSAEIVKKIISKRCLTLKELYPKKNLRTCVMLLNMEDKFVFDEPNLKTHVSIYPYYQGSKGLKDKYAQMENTKYFYYDKALQDNINDKLKAELTAKGIKNKKRLGLGEEIVYDNPKVYIRQSAKEIIASFDGKPSSANNSLYVFTLRNNSDSTISFLKFLCGFLNSELITFYAQQRKIIRFSNGKQPQIKVSDLYTIPIPTDTTLQTEISKLVGLIYESENSEKLINKIDDLVYKYFGLNIEEIQTIKESIESF